MVAPASDAPIMLTSPRCWTGPAPDSGGLPKGGGSMLCSRAIASSGCGTTKADWVGPYTLNMSCSSGFYDPIYGGTCWKCPDDTDDKGGWNPFGDRRHGGRCVLAGTKGEPLTGDQGARDGHGPGSARAARSGMSTTGAAVGPVRPIIPAARRPTSLNGTPAPRR